MAYTVTNNSPNPGEISWANLSIQYSGVTYPITDGSTASKYAYWDKSVSTSVLQTSNTFPNLADEDLMVFLNKSGTAVVVPGSHVIEGDIIVPGTILADALAANSVTSDKVIANGIVAEKIGADQIFGYHVVAGEISANHIVTEGLAADVIAAGTLTSTVTLGAGGVEKVGTAGKLVLDGTGLRLWDNVDGLGDPSVALLAADGSGSFKGAITGGTIDIGHEDDIPDHSFHIDADGRMWLGHTTWDDGLLRVTPQGTMWHMSGHDSQITGGHHRVIISSGEISMRESYSDGVTKSWRGGGNIYSEYIVAGDYGNGLYMQHGDNESGILAGLIWGDGVDGVWWCGGDMQADAYTYNSTRDIKANFREADWSPLQAVRDAPVMEYQKKRVDEALVDPGNPTSRTRARTLDPEPGDPWHYGFVAEDLPAIATADGRVHVNEVIGILWGAVRELGDEIARMRAGA